MTKYIGDDGVEYKNPCTSADGILKQRWPNPTAAWFVAELATRGKGRHAGKSASLYAYCCPKCDGYHLSTCRTKEHYRRHHEGVQQLKTSLAAGK